MPASPCAALLLLRESDVVRLCGLDAAARGLALVDRGRVSGARRGGSRLEATIREPAGAAVRTLVEVSGDAPPPTLRWQCDCPAGAGRALATGAEAGDDAGAAGLACEHVAALLTTWVRHPGALAAAPEDDRPARGDAVAHARAAPGRPPRAGADDAGGRSLADELERLPDAELAGLARRTLGAEVGASAERSALVGRLAEAVGAERTVRAVLGRLDPAATELLRAVALLGGAAAEAELGGVAGRAGLDRRAAALATAALRRHGLLFAGTGAARGTWRVPPQVAAVLPPVPALATLATAGPHGPPLVPEAAPDSGAIRPMARVRPATPRGMCVAAALLARTPGSLHPTAAEPGAVVAGRPRAAERAQALPRVPGDPPEAALLAWARSARLPAGQVRLARRVLRWQAASAEPGPSLRDLDRLPPADWSPALRAAFRHWLAAPSHVELADLTAERDGVRARCDPLQPALRPATLAAENAAARVFVAGLVARAPVGGWIALDAFVDLVWRLDPFFLRGRQRVFAQPAWWLEDGADGRPLDAAERDEWRRGEGRYVRALATGPLHWWGALDLAEDAAGEPRAMRLTPFGAYLLGAGPAPEGAIGALAAGWGAAALPAGPGRLAVQPLVAGPELLGALAAWARFTAVRGGRLIAQLSPDLASAGFDAGREPRGLLDRLRAADARDRTRAADALAPVLDEWRARHGGARIQLGLALLVGRDAAALREALAAAPALAARGRLVAPHLAALPAADTDEWERALRRRGFVV